jgi:hypothetical protein
MIEGKSVAVVVPAHNEEQLIGATLAGRRGGTHGSPTSPLLRGSRAGAAGRLRRAKPGSADEIKSGK